MTVFIGYIAGNYAGFSFKQHISPTILDSATGYGHRYGQEYGASIKFVQYGIFNAFTIYAGYTPSKLSSNVISPITQFGYGKLYGKVYGAYRSPRIPNYLGQEYFPNWYSEMLVSNRSISPEFAGIAFPLVYAHPISYLTDPNLLPQEWWHLENYPSYNMNVKQWNDIHGLLSNTLSSNNQWVGYGPVVK